MPSRKMGRNRLIVNNDYWNDADIYEIPSQSDRMLYLELIDSEWVYRQAMGGRIVEMDDVDIEDHLLEINICWN